MKNLTNLKQVLINIEKALAQSTKAKTTKLIAVSKKRTIEQVNKLYDEGQRLFGENYLNELEEKTALLPKDINWCFIGHLQSNKCRKLLKIPNLVSIQTVENLKLANILDSECYKLNRKVEVLLQVNISNEETKSGCKISETVSIYKEILTYKNLNLKGIMSLGTLNSIAEFELMYELKLRISNELSLPLEEVQLSFGTSDDYESAIHYGSNIVRVGTKLYI